MNPIPYGRHHITREDIQAVVDVLKSENLTQGPKVAEFESAFADYIGCKFAVAVANGTAALHLSALAMNIKPGDRVIATPITFAASSNCVCYCGGEVVFADIDPNSYLLDINKVRELLEISPQRHFKGIIPVHFSGRPVNMEAFRKLAYEFGLWIIEDACHAPGGYFVDSSGKKQYCGNGKYADLAIFSFHPVKHIACGEGGMITTNNDELYQKLLILRTHGITKDPNSLIENHGNWYYEMQDLGYNYRMTDFQAALGLSQLQRANDGLKWRKEIAAAYEKAFHGKPFINRQSGVIEGHGYHLYILEVEDRKGLYDYLQKHNIFAQVHYIPVHMMPYYRQFGWKKGDLPFAEKYYSQCLSLPMFPTLTVYEQKFVIEKINEFYA